MASHGGIGEDKRLQHNTFNNLYFMTERNAQIENHIRNKRVLFDLNTNRYDNNTMNQLPNSLQLNGHIYSQKLKPPIQPIFNRDFEFSGRNNYLYQALYEKKVNISGELFDNNSIPRKPLIDNTHQTNLFRGLVH